MIVRDVAPFIGSCLESVIGVCDEVIIVDTGSADDTKAVIAAKLAGHGVRHRILDFNKDTHPDAFMLDDARLGEQYGAPGPFSGRIMLADFAGARQHGWERTTSDYVLWLDSDDVVRGSDRIPAVLEAMAHDGLDSAGIDYEYGHDAAGQPVCVLVRERIIKRGAPGRWVNPIHEVFFPLGAGRFFSEFKIVHRRGQVVTTPAIPHRNLKVLLRQYDRIAAAQGEDAVDTRTLFYLGMEWRYLDSARAEGFLRKYISKSGWDEERALAHIWLGQAAEARGQYDGAFLDYAAAAINFQTNPEGLFGCGRVAYFKNDWARAAEYFERGREIVAKGPDKRSMLQYNPLDRTYHPLLFMSKTYVELGRIDDAIRVTKEALALNPHDNDEKRMMRHNLQVCEDWLAKQKQEQEQGKRPMRAAFSLQAPVEAPMPDLPPGAWASVAIQLWKYIAQHAGHAQALDFLTALPVDLHGSVHVKRAIELTRAALATAGPATAARRTVASAPVAAPTSPPASASASVRKLDIVIWTGPAWQPWHPRQIAKHGVGGSETAAAQMARCLAARGHHVRLFCDTGDDTPSIWEGVECLSYRAFPAGLTCDVFVTSRQPWALDMDVKASLKILWVHDIHVGAPNDGLLAQLAKADLIFGLSDWHIDFLKQTYPTIPADKFHRTRNGIDTRRFEQAPVKEGNRLIYASSPDRGLERLLELLPAIRQRVPDAVLHVYYGFDLWRASAGDDVARAGQINGLLRYLDDLAREGAVVVHGRVGQDELAQAFLASKVWAYPTWFTETSCITAMEAQAAGCVPVTTALAALPETVTHGILLPPPNTSDSYGRTFVDAVTAYLQDEKHRRVLVDVGRARALMSCDWSGVAAEWEALFLERTVVQPTATTTAMRLVFIMGRYATGLHGRLDPEDIYTTRALTGSESSFFNVVRGLQELGHKVEVFCDAPRAFPGFAKLAGADVYPIEHPIPLDRDVYVSLIEPDQFVRCPANKPRILWQQYNDFFYCRSGFEKVIDLCVALSPVHRQRLVDVTPALAPDAVTWLPNSTNVEFFDGEPIKRRPHSMAWCSSPDRGLHNLLDIFPLVRARIPDATLDIFYRFDPWYEEVKHLHNEIGRRARYIHERLAELGRNGENGVTVRGPVSNVQMARELRATAVLSYTCDCVAFTEGFSVAILDACAAGCVPVISAEDAIGDIYKGVAHVIPGKPDAQRDTWVEAICRAMTDEPWAAQIRARAQTFAAALDYKSVAQMWGQLLAAVRDRAPLPAPALPAPARVSASPAPTSPAHLRIDFLFSAHAAAGGRPFDPSRLLDSPRGLTGTELNMFGVARALAARGHKVRVFSLFTESFDESPCLSYRQIEAGPVQVDGHADVAIAYHDAQPLAFWPARLKIAHHQVYNLGGLCSRESLAAADVFTSATQRNLEHLRAIYAPGRPWHAVPNACDLGEYRPWQPVPGRIIFHTSAERGLGLLLDAFPKIRARVPEAHLVIVSRLETLQHRPQLLQKVMDAVRRYPIALHGQGLSRNALLGELSRAAVFAYPSEPEIPCEVWPISVMECCKAGVPVVLAPADGIEAVFGPAVDLAPAPPSRHLDDFVDRVVTALTDEGRAEQLSTRGRAFAGAFSFETSAAAYEAIITGALPPPLPPPASGTIAVTERRPKVSINLGSNRPGGIDITLAGLAAQTFQDFEVVFTDGRYHERHTQVLEAVRRSGLRQPFYHVPNYRYRDDFWGAICAGYNTGFALSAGEIVVMLLDYAYAPPHWLATHVEHQATPKIVLGPHEYRTLHSVVARGKAPLVEFTRDNCEGRPDMLATILSQRERFDEISIFPSPFTADRLDSFPVERSEIKCEMPTGQADWRTFNTKNESFPLETVLDINGMDEAYDQGRGPGDPDLGFRLAQRLPCWVVREAMVHCLNPRRYMPNINIVVPEAARLPAPHDHRWHFQEGVAYFERVRALGQIRAPNAFDIRDLRKRLWRWRELSQQAKPIIPMNVVL